MSKEAVQTIVGKAVVDREFRHSLFADPDEVLAGYELTGEEVVALKAMDAETVESFAGALDERISKAFVSAGLAGSGSNDLGGLYTLEDQWAGESGDLLVGRLVV
jgi:hypothetical protein